MTSTSKKQRTTAINYTELSEELSTVMARLEQGELDVDEAVKSYERGLEIIKMLEAHLTKAENRVSELKAASE
jgi:exodeoxyribonuclease VII small subunit